MFLIIFLWTPPHFWALSLLRSDDYARAGSPMLPVVAGHDETRHADPDLRADPRAVGRPRCSVCRRLYGAVALICGGVCCWRGASIASAGEPRRSPPETVRFSLLYVFVLFARCSRSMLARLGLLRFMSDDKDGIVLTEEQKRRRRARSIAIAVSLGVIVVLFYLVTLVKGPAVLNRPL
jgi:hypothetical protein